MAREGNFTRSGLEVTDEMEIFEGKENRISMYQTYTKRFQCEYHLHRYPFDTQVGYSLCFVLTHHLRYVGVFHRNDN